LCFGHEQVGGEKSGLSPFIGTLGNTLQFHLLEYGMDVCKTTLDDLDRHRPVGINQPAIWDLVQFVQGV
jgi:hypothetical protein